MKKPPPASGSGLNNVRETDQFGSGGASGEIDRR